MTLVQYLHRPLVILVKYLLVASFLVVYFSSELSRPAERVAKKRAGEFWHVEADIRRILK